MADFGPDAHEMINVLTLGMRLRLTADELDRPLSAYPSGASNIAAMFKPSS
jgi:pyruvate/2-oxoglutarate dehydrogenase complex dihydrolipoamide dehydrogenase (E3) component